MFLRKRTITQSNFKKFAEKFHNENVIVVLVEGDDDPKYYRQRISSHTENCIEFIKCGGKSKVINLFNFLKVKKGYENAEFLTFVDRDYDCLMNVERIYETPMYSIENFYTSFDTLRTYLEDILKMTDNDIEIILSLYKKLIQEYHESILDLNIWIYGQRLYVLDNEGGDIEIQKVNLNDKNLIDFINFSLEGINSLYSLEELNTIMEFDLPQEYIQKAKINIEDEDWIYRERFRGKFEVKFLYHFMIEFQKILTSKKPLPEYLQISKRYKIKTNFSDIIHELSGYAYTPSCLKHYIRKYVS